MGNFKTVFDVFKAYSFVLDFYASFTRDPFNAAAQ